MTTQCPDNSTDCLLRAILNANPGYNWDPLTFGFTAVFTIIAFIVSVSALFQQLVAAGPGRLKASARAIGSKQHQTRANTQFSWEEFRPRTIVQVPVIDVAKILEHESTAFDVDVGDDLPVYQKSRDVSRATNESSRVVAGWSQLLTDLSLTDVDFKTIQCLTDYLPDDVPAAPAWARVESIVLLSIMKGCIRLLENLDGYIDATGPSSQLAWNMHPGLGPMAIYRTWDIMDTGRHTLQDVQKMVPTFLGQLQFMGEILYKPLGRRRGDIPVIFDFRSVKKLSLSSWEKCHHDHESCFVRRRGLWSTYLESEMSREGDVDKKSAALASAVMADRPMVAKAFPTRATDMHEAIKIVYEEYFPWLILADDLNDNVLTNVCGSDFVEFDSRDASAGPYDKTCLTSWLPSVARQVMSKPDTGVHVERPMILPPPRDSTLAFKLSQVPTPSIDMEKIQSSRLRIARPAVRHVSKWLADESYFATAAFFDISDAQTWLRYQLAELDWFLSGMGDDIICAAFNVIALGTIKFGVIQYTKLSRRFIMPEVLDAFNLEWEHDGDNSGYILVKGYLESQTVQRLFAYSWDYIHRNRKNLHTVKCAKAAQGFYYATKKPSAKSALTQTLGVPAQAGSEGLSGSTPGSDPPTKAADELQTQVTRSDTDSSALQSAITQELSNDTITQWSEKGDPKSMTLSEAEVHAWVDRKERRASGVGDDEVVVRVDERVSALEALAFFRAAVFAALLASGTDTSLILMSEKRYQLVQVQ